MNLIKNISKSRSFLMGIAMVAVLMFHQEFVQGNCVLDFLKKYGHWGVPVFIFVSGFGIWYALDKPGTIPSFYIRRLWRIMPVSILGGVLALALTWEINIAKNLLKISGLSLWYIRTILIFYLVSPALYVLFKGTKRTLWYVLLLLVAFAMFYVASYTMEYWWMGIFQLEQTVLWTLGQAPFYLSGMYLAAAAAEKEWKTSLLILACCCLLHVVFKLIYGEPFWFGLVRNASVLLICGFGYYLYKVLPINVNKSIEWCGKHSLELYVCHEAIYAFLYNMNKAAYMLPIALVASFFAAYGISLAGHAIDRLRKRWTSVV